MIVVDTNIIAYLVIPGDRTDAVERLLELDSDWVAPRLWIDEFLNVLATLERTDRISSEQATDVLTDALALMDNASYDIPPERVLSVAQRTECSAYDSQYIALAEDLGLKLYTCNQGVLKKCSRVAVEPR